MTVMSFINLLATMLDMWFNTLHVYKGQEIVCPLSKTGKPFFTIYNSFTDLLLAWTKTVHCVCVCLCSHVFADWQHATKSNVFTAHTGHHVNSLCINTRWCIFTRFSRLTFSLTGWVMITPITCEHNYTQTPVDTPQPWSKCPRWL